MNIGLERTEWYFQHMQEKTEEAYRIAQAARAKGKDPETKVEIPPAADLAARVEGLVGPKGVAEKIRELLKSMDRDDMTLRIIDKIVEGEFGEYETEEELAEQCIRTGLAIITEAVPAAATEGISHTRILDNPDGTRCLEVYYAGPIRSAGGTAAALSVALADYTRRKMGLQDYRPSKEEVERYVEEIGLYHNLVSRLQYSPPEDDVRHIVSNCPVCVSGTPTSELEVSVYKNLPRIETNRIRGGMALVIAEGIAQKAAKLLKYSKKFGLGWDWIESIVRVTKKTGEKREIKPITKYLSDIVGGRPIFAYPSQTGGLRLRYGRSRNTGLNAKGVNPATMYLTNEFMAIGTQLKLERPGKGCVTVPVSTIEGPTVLLDNGDVVKVNSASKAMEVKDQVSEIIFLGDLLVSHGDFLKANHPLVKPGICEEWWQKICEKEGVKTGDPWSVSSEEAVKLAKQGAPMHPKYTYFYNSVSPEDLVEMAVWLSKGNINWMQGIAGEQSRVLEASVSEEKRTLEKIGVPHKLRGGRVLIEEAGPLIETLCLEHVEDLKKAVEEENSLPEALTKACGFKVMDKGGTFIGARMGRPEKAKPRRMSPPPNLLFPIGKNGGKTRTLLKAAEKEVISVEAVRLRCPKCGKEMMSYYCHDCGARTQVVYTCTKCGKKGRTEKCAYCGGRSVPYAHVPYNIKNAVKAAEQLLREKTPEKTKAVEGLINEKKVFEPIEKGILRAKHNVVVFRDGTIRFDATNLPITHFKPREIGLSVEKARELGYTHDKNGAPLADPDQVCEMFVQDIIIPAESVEYIILASKFVDDLLEKFYELPRYYNAEKPEDLAGHLVICLAPHISVGVLGRIIGVSRARGTYAHPYMHAATRRDCDGDENAFMLLLDALLNFSRSYLPSSRGGTMDAAIVLTTKIDPEEVDDQVHEMDVAGTYPLEYYEAACNNLNPSDVKISLVKERLGKLEQYYGLDYTHETNRIDEGPVQSAYTTLKTMAEKVEKQLELGEKVLAVDERDLARRVINFHFMRDMMGNLRAFGQQAVRCVDCNRTYRRAPLAGKCVKCGGKLVLTVSKGGIVKYLDVSKNIAKKYHLSDYLQQRLLLIENDVKSFFELEEREKRAEREKQKSLADFV